MVPVGWLMFTLFTSERLCSEVADTNTHFFSDRCSCCVSRGSWKSLSLLFSFLLLPSLYLGSFPLATLPASVCRSPLFKSDRTVTVASGRRGSRILAIFIFHQENGNQTAVEKKTLITVVFLCGSKLWLEGLWISYQVFKRAKKARRHACHASPPTLIWAGLISASDSGGSLPDAKRCSEEEPISTQRADAHRATIWQCLHLLRATHEKSCPA